MLDLLPKNDKINVDKKCYVNQIKNKSGEFSEERPAFGISYPPSLALCFFLEGEMKKICLQCGKEFEKPSYERLGVFKRRKYCNILCSNESKKGIKRPPFSKEWKRKMSESGKKKVMTPEHIRKIRENHNPLKGSKHPFWKGGKTKNKKGYVLISKKEHPYSSKYGLIFEHRLVMEEHIGRYLTPEEVVHHNNGIPDDNRIENLKLFKSQSIHISSHKKNFVCNVAGCKNKYLANGYCNLHYKRWRKWKDPLITLLPRRKR